MVHTGIFSEETGRPQPLRFSVSVRMKPIAHYDPETSLDASTLCRSDVSPAW